MKSRKHIWQILTFWILTGCGIPFFGTNDETHTAGTNDETHTTLAARFLLPGGKEPAVGAKVTVVPYNQTRAIASGHVDAEGHPVISSLADGKYSISVQDRRLVVYLDTVWVKGGLLGLTGPDTLAPAGGVRGIVKVQPQHSPSSVTVHVLGTEVFANVHSDGTFFLDTLGAGNLRLSFETTMPEYVTTYETVLAQSGADVAMRDTVRMIYTGIPVVLGLKVVNDSATGDQLLSWSRVEHAQLLDYLVYRDPVGSLTYSNTPLAATASTSWRDTTADNPVIIQAWKYRVVARIRGGSTGAWFGVVESKSVPPQLAHVDGIRWEKLNNTPAMSVGDLNGRMALLDTVREGFIFRLGVRTSADGRLWDSTNFELPGSKSGQILEWSCGFGAHRLWCLGHSSLGEGVEVRSTEGLSWRTEWLNDTLWPSHGVPSLFSGGGRFGWSTPNRPNRMTWTSGDGQWTITPTPGRVLGLTDSGFMVNGGGVRLLETELETPTRILRDWGPWLDGMEPELAYRWGTQAVLLANQRAWLGFDGVWSLRQGALWQRLQPRADRLLALDLDGRLWSGATFP